MIAFSPGEYIQDELTERGWTPEYLASITGRPVLDINQIIAGKVALSADWAAVIAVAFGTSVELWLRLEANYNNAQRRPNVCP